MRLYNSGLSLREVGERMTPPRSHEGVRLLLLAAGVELREPHVTLASGRKASTSTGWTGGERDPGAENLSRFGHAKIDVSQATGLKPDHPAVMEGRTLFPSTVVAPAASPRLLVSGHNNPKLGKQVMRGDRAGWPIFHLALEERATCPRSCAMWGACYGNAMHMARRHRADDDLMPRLRREIGVLAAKHRQGVLIRLHTLGDFFSVEYVAFWAEILRDHPNVACFGYTARRVDDEDRNSARIARALKVLTDGAWSRFAIRTSHVEAGPERSVVVDDAPLREDVVLCPTQTEATQACATCGICWAAGSRSKTIAFLRHGMKRKGRKMVDAELTAEPEPPVVDIPAEPATVNVIAPSKPSPMPPPAPPRTPAAPERRPERPSVPVARHNTGHALTPLVFRRADRLAKSDLPPVREKALPDQILDALADRPLTTNTLAVLLGAKELPVGDCLTNLMRAGQVSCEEFMEGEVRRRRWSRTA
ncbi:GP88 family protein [Phenylobacterium conjunctum]|uniref:Gene product 88 domain-containing protein n=1 Tax=Phenylobacterium conjunctum TaxID=1298959 RepID=A0ABW3SYM6_9CAUL